MRLARLALALAGAGALLPAAVNVQQYNTHDFVFRAKAPGNPFDVALAGDFTGPDGVRLRVPGFYDGADTWKIRFSPTRTGAWSMRTSSSLSALNGMAETGIACVPNQHPQIHGGLRVDPAHPHHFVWEDGTRYFLLGFEANWLWAPQMSDPKRPAMRRLIDLMASRGFNHVMVNVCAHDTRWAPGKSCEWDYGPPEMYAWEGTNEKPDHSRLNPRFFQLYDGMMEALRDKGIVAHIMLKVYNKQVKWPERGSADEEKYFRYVTARYQAFSNVVWDYSKESYNEKDDQLQSRLIDLVRASDAYRRLTTAHDDDAYEWDPALNRNLDFRTDQQHSFYPDMIRFDRALRNYPVLNAEFGYEYGVEKLPTHTHTNQCDWQEHLRRAWHIYMADGYGVYYYNNTAWDTLKPDPEPPGMARWQILKDVLSPLPFWRMTPRNDLAVGGPCLAEPGGAHVIYVPQAAVTANLAALRGPAAAEWIDTWTGVRVSAGTVQPGLHAFQKPKQFGEAPAVLVVK